MSNFAFGIIYFENNGKNAPSSQYFEELGSAFPVQFAVNFKGLGLPKPIYDKFITLLEYITDNKVTCDKSLNGYCSLPSYCNNYPIGNYHFLVNLTDSNLTNFMLVPLNAF